MRKDYDSFIGQELIEDRTYITYRQLKGSGLVSARFSLEGALGFLTTAVKSGERVLLSKAPESVGERSRNAKERLYGVIAACDQYPQHELVVPTKAMEHSDDYVVRARRFEPLTAEQLRELRARYDERDDLKRFPNPFTYQPR